MTTATMTLTDFLLARIAEDEAPARIAADDRERELMHRRRHGGGPVFRAHYERHHPARVLAECAAKRLVLTMHEDYMSSVRAYRSPRWQEVEDDANRADRLKAEARGRVSSE